METTVKTQKESPDNLMLAVREIWHDFKTGKIEWERLRVDRYIARYSVRKFPKNLIAPLLLKRTEPTEQDLEEFRLSLNAYAREKKSKEAYLGSVEDEKTAIAILKKKGYRVMKKTTAYKYL